MSVIVIVNVSFAAPEAGMALAVTVQTKAPPQAIVGAVIVVALPKSEAEIEAATTPEPEAVAPTVKVRVPVAVSTALPGATTSGKGKTVTVVVPVTPVLSIAVTVAVPAMASAVNTPVVGTILPISVALKEYVYGVTPPVAVNVWFPPLIICGLCGTMVIPKEGPTSAAPSLSKSPVQASIAIIARVKNSPGFHRLMDVSFLIIFLFTCMVLKLSLIFNLRRLVLEL